MLEISIYTNVHGHHNYGLVLAHGKTGMVQLLLDPFVEFPKASPENKQSRIRWVTPVATDSEGPGTRIYPLGGQRIDWQTPEIPQLIAAGPPAIAERLAALEAKYCATRYE